MAPSSELVFQQSRDVTSTMQDANDFHAAFDGKVEHQHIGKAHDGPDVDSTVEGRVVDGTPVLKIELVSADGRPLASASLKAFASGWKLQAAELSCFGNCRTLALTLSSVFRAFVRSNEPYASSFLAVLTTAKGLALMPMHLASHILRTEVFEEKQTTRFQRKGFPYPKPESLVFHSV